MLGAGASLGCFAGFWYVIVWLASTVAGDEPAEVRGR